MRLDACQQTGGHCRLARFKFLILFRVIHDGYLSEESGIGAAEAFSGTSSAAAAPATGALSVDAAIGSASASEAEEEEEVVAVVFFGRLFRP